MIIKAPTGLFSALIPRKVNDSGSVTFTISNREPPPPSPRTIAKIPDSAMARPLPVLDNRVLDTQGARALLGSRLLTITQGSRINRGSGAKLFEPGEFIESGGDLTAVEQRSVPGSVRIRLDTNLLDFEGAGLSAEEAETVKLQAEKIQDEIRSQIAERQTSIEQLRVQIRDTQRAFNETAKIRKATADVFGVDVFTDSTGNDIHDKLAAREAALITERDELVAEVNEINAEVRDLRDRLLRVSEVTR